MSRLDNVAIYVIEGKRCLSKTTVAINWMRCNPNKRDVFLIVPTRDGLESYLRRHLLAKEVLIDREGPSEKPVIRKITLEELYGPEQQPEPKPKPIDLKSLSKHDNYVVGRLSADILFERDQKAGHLREIEALEGSLKNLADKISEKKQIICGIEKAEREALEAIELLIGGAS